MIETLVKIDKELFLFLNGINSPLFDVIMYQVSKNIIWIPFYLYIIYKLYSQFKWKAVIVLLFVALVVTLADRISVLAFKNVFERLRPCHDISLQGMVHIVNGKCGGEFGFVSSHAANTFGVAIFLHKIMKNRLFSVFIITWAVLVSYSRIYLGVHFPGDILCGGILGGLIGYLIYTGYLRFAHKVVVRR